MINLHPFSCWPLWMFSVLCLAKEIGNTGNSEVFLFTRRKKKKKRFAQNSQKNKTLFNFQVDLLYRYKRKQICNSYAYTPYWLLHFDRIAHMITQIYVIWQGIKIGNQIREFRIVPSVQFHNHIHIALLVREVKANNVSVFRKHIEK